MQLDQSADYLVWDNTISVAYTHYSRTGSTVETLTPVKRRPLNLKEQAASRGAYQAGDVMLIVPQALITGAQPRQADYWQQGGAGDFFTVLDGSGAKLDQSGNYQTWRLHSRNLKIAAGLGDTVDVEQCQRVQGSGADVQRLWPSGKPAGGIILYAAVPCRVQPEEAQIVAERGKRGQATKYTVFVGIQLSLLDVRECRLKWTPTGQAPVYLDIETYTDPEQIGELPRLAAVRKV